MKRNYSIYLVIIILVSCESGTNPKPPEHELDWNLAKWYQNKRAAISITYDTGAIASSTVQMTTQEVLDRGLIYDFEFVNTSLWTSKIEYIRDFCIPNNIQFFGHGAEHINHDALTYEEALASVAACADTMQSLGLKVVSFAYPGGFGFQQETRQAVRDGGFYSARNYNLLDHYDPYIIPDNSLIPKNWYRLPSLMMEDIEYAQHGWAINNTAELIPFLDTTLEKKAWLIITYHSIGFPPPAYGFYNLQNFLTDLDAIKERDFWNASMNDITLYAYERAATVVWDSVAYDSSEVSEILLRLEDHLDDDTFDHELTLNISLPDIWTGAEIQIIDDGVLLDILSVDSSRASLNLLPNNHTYTLRIAN
jgi:hypothetical protein